MLNTISISCSTIKQKIWCKTNFHLISDKFEWIFYLVFFCCCCYVFFYPVLFYVCLCVRGSVGKWANYTKECPTSHTKYVATTAVIPDIQTDTCAHSNLFHLFKIYNFSRHFFPFPSLSFFQIVSFYIFIFLYGPVIVYGPILCV